MYAKKIKIDSIKQNYIDIVNMIIPIRCMSCGKTIADKWRYYQEELKKATKNKYERYYFDGKDIPETQEKKIMDDLGLKRPCCRKHFLTQIDLLDKL